jgi:hypothetical protein
MEYDNTNRGAGFAPRPEQNMILTGKLNLRGDDMNVVLVKDTDHKGQPIIGVFKRVGVLFANDKKNGDNDPDYSGPIEDMRLAAWKNTSKEGHNFLSMKASEKQQQSDAPQPQPQTATAEAIDDVVPF